MAVQVSIKKLQVVLEILERPLCKTQPKKKFETPALIRSDERTKRFYHTVDFTHLQAAVATPKDGQFFL